MEIYQKDRPRDIPSDCEVVAIICIFTLIFAIINRTWPEAATTYENVVRIFLTLINADEL